MGYVYRYIDNSDGIIKYIGIVYGKDRTLHQRIYEHKVKDDWCRNKDFTIEYIQENINTRTDAELFEAHYISLYGTDKFFNTRKSGWGISSYLPNRENDWIKYDEEFFSKDDPYYIYRVHWKEDEEFYIKPIPAIKRICKRKKGGVDSLHCKCGCKDFYKKDQGNGHLYCKECGAWVRQCDYDLRELYTPEYNGEYVIENGQVVTYDYYTICFNRKNCWESYEKDILERVTSKYPPGFRSIRKDSMTAIHTFAISEDEIDAAKIRILNYIKNTKETEILDIKGILEESKQRVKELPVVLKEKNNDYDRFLDKFNFAWQ